ncbi:hypothetical protein [Streptomyces sp. CB02400]|uniref:hypothetical protein n=1 Tax=Streptomyces sp. CB02400 TaxID=1703944 RepID=UPI00191270D8|nr:hypothetical protein [Streptomyces sp. CB02400]
MSKVERGERSASPELARRYNAFLGANGELWRLAVRPGSDSDTAETPATPTIWLVGRRAVLSAGTGALIDLGLKLSGQAPAAADEALEPAGGQRMAVRPFSTASTSSPAAGQGPRAIRPGWAPARRASRMGWGRRVRELIRQAVGSPGFPSPHITARKPFPDHR